MNEMEIMNSLRNENDEFKQLEVKHKELEDSLNELLKKKYLTSEEELVKKKIQKQKLQFKDRMAELVRTYR